MAAFAVLDCELNTLFEKVELAPNEQVTKSLRSILEEEGPCTVRELGRRYEAQCGCAFKAAAGVAVHAFLGAHHADFAVAHAQEGRSLPFKDVVSLRSSESKADRARSATTSSARSSGSEPEPEEQGLALPIPRKSRLVKNTFVSLPIETDLYDADVPRAPSTCPVKKRMSLVVQVQVVGAPSPDGTPGGSPRTPGCSPHAFPQEYDLADCPPPALGAAPGYVPADPMAQMQMLLQAQTQTIIALQNQVHALQALAQQQGRQIAEAKQ